MSVRVGGRCWRVPLTLLLDGRRSRARLGCWCGGVACVQHALAKARPICVGVGGRCWRVPRTLLLEAGGAGLDWSGWRGLHGGVQHASVTLEVSGFAGGKECQIESLNEPSDRAEREGFEPSRQVNPAYTISNRAPSTTRTPLQSWGSIPASWWWPRRLCGAGFDGSISVWGLTPNGNSSN